MKNHNNDFHSSQVIQTCQMILSCVLGSGDEITTYDEFCPPAGSFLDLPYGIIFLNLFFVCKTHPPHVARHDDGW
jgi:hypothetical protein